MGQPARTVPIGWVVPAATFTAACCPAEEHWFDLKEAPVVGDVYPDASPEDRYFRGSSALKVDCLTAEGFLEARQVSHRAVTCAAVRCGGPPTPAEAAGTAQVLVPTDKLKALAKNDRGSSWDVAVGEDQLGPVLAEERQSWSKVSATFQLVEDLTPLGLCVLEERSRAPGPNRKSTYLFERSGGAWR